ncbi:putative signal peptide-containing protein [Acinetobacter oleivorans DR1]|uniref:Signal peptide-containing protein n=2 Tax=Acinetobacter oleivorans TaxID=1148157 RepID=A0AAN0P5F2_ACISD|nr:putative signal peptide-containing protein [Acinetobacter oleivorans DR1]
MLSTALPNETTEIKTITLKTDQIIALGQAVKNEQEQGLVFIGQDYNYLMNDGSSNLLNIIKSIPAEQRTIKTPSPLVLEMDDSTHFHGEITIRYNIPTSQMDEKQKELLKTLGFKNQFMAIENQQQVFYPFTIIRFKGKIYQKAENQKIQQQLSVPYPVALQQKDEITKKHPFKRVTRMALYPLAMTFDVITVAPSLIWSDLHGDFNK